MNMFDSEELCRALFAQFAPPRVFVVAYSGGCDSHVLLHALMHARRRGDVAREFQLRAAHFDHGLLPESAEWAARCEAVCREWGIPFQHARREVRKAPQQSLEAAARHARYRWFAQCIARGQVLLTAHHADDQAETLLLNALRGGGVHSLAGIRPLRMLSAAKGTRVARPLLAFSRAQLAEYARAHRLRWIDDRSNRALQFDRNHLRHEIIPLLRQRWPGAP
ncbi:MAG: tRNA lysidine(34) synthetase TilS, partial [Gammaproteobacteria bacterium]